MFISKQIFKFVISGGAAAATDLAILYVCTEYLGFWYLASLVPAFAVSLAVSFTLQKFWTFESTGTHALRMQMTSYLALALADLALNAVLLYALVEFAHVWYLAAQACVYGVIAVVNFLFYKFVIFKKKPAPLAPSGSASPSHDS